MTAKRRYRLLRPIARALDAVGDRWALLIVRDLHAGPARFHDLETGLGIATNLLSTRLTELTEAGLIEKSTAVGRGVYQLTSSVATQTGCSGSSPASGDNSTRTPILGSPAT